MVDFVCEEKKVIIEIDGGYHDYVNTEDQVRQRELERMGWSVIRYSNDDVLMDLESVFLDLAKRLTVNASG